MTTYTTPLRQAQADLYAAVDALSLAFVVLPLDKANSDALRRMNKALWDVKCAMDAEMDAPPPIAGVTPSVEECVEAFYNADHQLDRCDAIYCGRPFDCKPGISAVRDLCLAQAAERKGASREWASEYPSVQGWYWCRKRGCEPFAIELVDQAGELMALLGGYSLRPSDTAMLDDFDDHEWSPLSLTTPTAPWREETT